MIKAAIIGATGYVGQELMHLLLRHPETEVISVESRSFTNEKLSTIYPKFSNITEIKCTGKNIKELSKTADVIFTALPHGVTSSMITEEVIKNTVVIDLGADYRIDDLATYEQWYIPHGNPHLIKDAVYGLCEFNRDKIKFTNLVANPGCYTTCSILNLAPSIYNNIIDTKTIVVDAKSGVTGAGRGLNQGTHYPDCNESIKAYKIASHRHTPEIEQEISKIANKEITITFTPHLVPMNRGILAVSYSQLIDNISEDEVIDLYKEYYNNQYFIRILDKGIYPETRWVKGSNYCDIGIKVDKRTNRLIVVSAIDNLLKGAASQAVQNMNIRFGIEEKMGIDMIPGYPI
jgi:N-acetyl-gamma-glutamyl-phosphate reductase